MRIGIDMMGGDYAPKEAVLGALDFIQSQSDDTHIVMFGNQPALEELLPNDSAVSTRYTIIPTTEVIGMHEHPTKALKEKPDSSIAQGFRHLAIGEIDAFISAGNTGAMMVGALFSIKTIEGIARPSIGACIPREDGTMGLLMDVGLNADCKPENLNQFAMLGSLYAEHVLGIPQPRVGLINLGEEEGKGNLLTQATYPLLKENPSIHFIGNIEGRDILIPKADVMVCDGFTGNVVLKLAESVYDITRRRNIQDDHFDRYNFQIYGGVPVLGVSKPVIIGHGISEKISFVNMIKTASRIIQVKLNDRIRDRFVEQAQPISS